MITIRAVNGRRLRSEVRHRRRLPTSGELWGEGLNQEVIELRRPFVLVDYLP